MLAQLEIVPVGTSGASLSHQLADVARLIDSSGLDYRLGPMGTTVEGEWDAVMALAKRCHEAALQQATRVMTFITIDDRTDRLEPGRILQKMVSLEERVGKSLKR